MDSLGVQRISYTCGVLFKSEAAPLRLSASGQWVPVQVHTCLTKPSRKSTARNRTNSASAGLLLVSVVHGESDLRTYLSVQLRAREPIIKLGGKNGHRYQSVVDRISAI